MASGALEPFGGRGCMGVFGGLWGYWEPSGGVADVRAALGAAGSIGTHGPAVV